MKRIWAFALVGAMVTGLVGCAGNNASTAESVTETLAEGETEGQTTAVTSAAAGDEWMTPYDETVTLSTIRGSSYDLPDGYTLEDSIWTRKYKEVFNVEVVTDWSSDDYDTKLNLAIASGNLPDVFVASNSQFQQLMEADMLMDMTDVYETWASDKLKESYEIAPGVLETAMKDGRIYGFPKLYSGEQVPLLWLRDDWMKELGAKAPTTVDELEEILLALKEYTGGHSFAVDKSLESLYQIANAWGAYPTIWVKNDDGEIVYGATTDEMKAAVLAWSEWYKEGILRKDFATMDGDAVKEEIVSGKVGAHSYMTWWGWVYGDIVENQGVDAAFYPYEIPTTSGEKAYYPLKYSNTEYICVSKTCKNPDAVVKLIDYYSYIMFEALKKGDMTEKELEVFTAGNMQHTSPMFQVNYPNDDMNRHIEVAEALNTGDVSVLSSGISVESYEGALRWRDGSDPTAVGYGLQWGDGAGFAYEQVIFEEDRLQRDELWGATPQILLDYGSTLSDILVEGFTKIITGVEDISYFDTLVASWYAAGGDETTAAINEAFNR